MVRRVNFYLFCIVICLTIVLFLNNYQCTHKNLDPVDKLSNTADLPEFKLTNHDGSPNIEAILDQTRLKIKHELIGYNLTNSGVSTLEDLVMERGGAPVRSLIVSAWRSGSTFFGELLNAMPSNFYHYEPLMKFKIKQIRGPPDAVEATRILKSLLLCNFTNMEEYFEYAGNHLDYLNQFEPNKRLWKHCKQRIELCFDADFTAKYCKLFPFQSMKVVRFRMHLAEDILNDKWLNVKVVLLVRDPRGLLQSRRYRNYCRASPDCIEPRVVCQDMINDYNAAARLVDKYPGRLMVLRFEDLAINLNKTTAQILNFLKLGPTQEIAEFLHKHTNVEDGRIDTTYRNTRAVPFKWKRLLNFEYVDRIQEACKLAMELWGYRSAHNSSHMASQHFHPLLPYTLTLNHLNTLL